MICHFVVFKHEMCVVNVPGEKFVQWFLLLWLNLPKNWRRDLMEYRKGKNGFIKSTRTWTLADVEEQYGAVWRFRSESSGNAVLFVLSQHCVRSWFSMLVEEWGLHRPPLLKVFHRGESSDIQRHPKSLSSLFVETMKHSPVLPRLG